MSERKFQPLKKPLKTLFPKAFAEEKFQPLKTLLPNISEKIQQARVRGDVTGLAEDYRAGMAAAFCVPVEWIREEPVEAWITKFTSAFVKPEHVEEVMERLVEGQELLPRGTELGLGTAREGAERGRGVPLTEEEQVERHSRVFGAGSGKTRTM